MKRQQQSIFDALGSKRANFGTGSANMTDKSKPSSIDHRTQDTTLSTGASAFDIMLKASRQQGMATRTEQFALNLIVPATGASSSPKSPSFPYFSWSWEAKAAQAGPPCEVAWHGEVRLRQSEAGTANKSFVIVCLATNCPSAVPASEAVNKGDPLVRLSPSILKSCLQKSIRRGLVEQTARIVKEMFTRDPGDLLRRLPIILVEDVGFLHPALPVLVWLMLAVSAGYAPSEVHASAVIAIASGIAACRFKDVSPKAAVDGGAESHHFDAIPPSQACLLRCIQARASFGGMSGDVAMLHLAVKVWYKRFYGDIRGEVGAAEGRGSEQASRSVTGEDWRAPAPLGGGGGGTWLELLGTLFGVQEANKERTCPQFAGPLPLLTSIPRLRASDLPLAGVDFHCSNVLQDVLASTDARAVQARRELGPGSVEQHSSALSGLMWSRRSGLNCRTPLSCAAASAVEASAALAISAHDRALLGSQAAVSQGLPTPNTPEGRAYRLLEPLVEQWVRSFLAHRIPQ